MPCLKSTQGHNVVDISCGGLHNAAVLSTGALWTWGCNDEKALGRLGTDWEASRVIALAHKRVVQVVAGDSHTTALTADGEVYNWGTYRDLAGILGFSDDVDKQVLPRQIAELKGAHHLLAFLFVTGVPCDFIQSDFACACICMYVCVCVCVCGWVGAIGCSWVGEFNAMTDIGEFVTIRSQCGANCGGGEP
jgi:hypothetical protein